jgi:hypothetical protein
MNKYVKGIAMKDFLKKHWIAATAVTASVASAGAALTFSEPNQGALMAVSALSLGWCVALVAEAVRGVAIGEKESLEDKLALITRLVRQSSLRYEGNVVPDRGQTKDGKPQGPTIH